MPKEITHIFNALCVANSSQNNKTSKQIQNLTNKYPRYYALGAVSPDILYYDSFSINAVQKKIWGVHWARAIHGVSGENTMTPVLAMIDILKNTKRYETFLGFHATKEMKEKAFCFALGFCTHAAMDITMHPVVYHFAGDFESKNKKTYKKAITIHRALETILDLYVLEKNNLSLKKFNTVKRIKIPKQELIFIFSFFTLALRLAFGGNNVPVSKTIKENYKKNIVKDPLYKAFIRSFKKQNNALRMFQSRLWYKISQKINGKTEKISFISSLFYPAFSYQEYLKMNNSFSLDKLVKYKDPFTGKEKDARIEVLLKKSADLSIQFCDIFYQTVYNKLSLNDTRKKLKGDSFATGRKLGDKRKMGFIKELNLYGNFKTHIS
ncbi:MAG: zinc dependent phospholipase C family protein [Spirochaetia bacterium]|nr:zinc dependent phospholipase C family protein [Spirochaetia bacterium]